MAEWREGKKENKTTFSFSYIFSYEYSSYYMIYGKNAKNARSSKKMAHYLFFFPVSWEAGNLVLIVPSSN